MYIRAKFSFIINFLPSTVKPNQKDTSVEQTTPKKKKQHSKKPQQVQESLSNDQLPKKTRVHHTLQATM